MSIFLYKSTSINNEQYKKKNWHNTGVPPELSISSEDALVISYYLCNNEEQYEKKNWHNTGVSPEQTISSELN